MYCILQHTKGRVANTASINKRDKNWLFSYLTVDSIHSSLKFSEKVLEKSRKCSQSSEMILTLSWGTLSKYGVFLSSQNISWTGQLKAIYYSKYIRRWHLHWKNDKHRHKSNYQVAALWTAFVKDWSVYNSYIHK